MKFKKLKLNQALLGYRKGDIVTCAVDHTGVILDAFWRRRLNDSAIDNCVEVAKEVAPKKKKLTQEDN